MPILPVLDLMNGQIVRGIAGRREEYRPIVSKLVDSAEPLAVARAFREHFGFTELYLADLDAIQHLQPANEVYASLADHGFRLWIDAGIRSHADSTLRAILGLHETSAVLGLESLDGPGELRQIVEHADAERIVFSLDLKSGKSLGRTKTWASDDPWDIAQQAIAHGVKRMIVLDLSRVGVGDGVGTEELCVRLKKVHPKLQLTAGGGVRSIDDVNHLISIGVDFVLVASALHDGRIAPTTYPRHS